MVFNSFHPGTDWFLTVFIRQSKGCKRSGILVVVIIIMAVGLFLQYFILICLITLASEMAQVHYVYKYVMKTLVTTEWSLIFTFFFLLLFLSVHSAVL